MMASICAEPEKCRRMRNNWTSCKKPDHLSISLKNTRLEVVINGYYDTPYIVFLPNINDTLLSIVNWLERILKNNGNNSIVLEIVGNRHYLLNYTSDNETLGHFYIHDCNSGMMKAISTHKTDDFVRNFYNHLKWDCEKIQCPVQSDFIEDFYMTKPTLRFESKGYFTILRPNRRDLRYYGCIYKLDSYENLKEHGGLAAENEEEAKQRFLGIVESLVEAEKWRETNRKWHQENTDIESIGCVYDILPEKFRERVISGQFDKTLLEHVYGGDYTVPLPYVTKAWDVLLKGELGHYAFMIGPEEDNEDDYETTLRELIEEKHATRTRLEAIRQNDEIIKIWKEKLNVDIDGLDVDFTQFNMHMPPNISDSEYEDYFFNVPDGVFEWILTGVNNPNGKCTFESVSALMEFTALIIKEREKW